MDITGGEGIGLPGGTTIGINTTGSTSAVHTTVERRVTFGELCNRNEISFQGPFSEVLEYLKEVKVGEAYDSSDLDIGEGDTGAIGAPRVASVTVSRVPGGGARGTIAINQNKHVCSIGGDWTEVSKPIRTWHADKSSGAPDLDLIRRWEQQKEANPTAYASLKVGTTDLTGDTKSLASFIYKGIESYSRYAPVLTISCNIESPERVGELYPPIGSVSADPPAPNGWMNAAGKTVSDIVTSFGNSPTTGQPYKWLLVKNTMSPNADGTFAWQIAWQGADEIEEDLYTNESGE